MSREYIEKQFEAIREYGNAIEQRLDDSGLSQEWLIAENERNLRLCRAHGCRFILLEDAYRIPLEEIM